MQFEQLKAHVMRGAGVEVAAPEPEASQVTAPPAPVAQQITGQNGSAEVRPWRLILAGCKPLFIKQGSKMYLFTSIQRPPFKCSSVSSDQKCTILLNAAVSGAFNLLQPLGLSPGNYSR